MGWRLVVQPSGKLARFSSVVDDFTHYNMSEDEAKELDADPYLMARKLSDAYDNPDRFEEAIDTISVIHGDTYASQVRKELSGNNTDKDGSDYCRDVSISDLLE